jgi:hypothetical protein
MDVRMPDMDRPEATKKIEGKRPGGRRSGLESLDQRRDVAVSHRFSMKRIGSRGMIMASFGPGLSSLA